MIRIIAVGKLKDRRLAELQQEYVQRIRGLAPVKICEVRDSNPVREDRDLVGQLGSPAGNELVLALDELGEQMTSREFATLLGQHGSISFLIGGADGLGPLVGARVARRLRLSSMTLTHEMARILLVEQVYRGLSILRGLPYHRD
jgi:23S rRNA (pseudouridine1915-N3)-methyltransferase